MIRSPLASLSLAALLGAALSVISSCGGPTVIRCTPSNCGGCCTEDGRCVLGSSDANACGRRGTACVACGAASTCIDGACEADPGLGGGVGGNTGGGNGGGATGGGATGGGATGGGAAGGGTGGASGGGAGTDTNAQIAAVRSAVDMDAGAVSLIIDGALVTYLKPQVPDAGNSDPAGFVVQASKEGPAVFVALDPATLSGGPLVVGDTVSFRVTLVARGGGIRTVRAVESLSKSSSGNPVSGFVQDVSAVDLSTASAIDGYECELISLAGQVVGGATSSGSGYRAHTFTSSGTLAFPDGGSPMQLRLTAALADSADLTPGCRASIDGTPLWRFNARAQPSAFSDTELGQISCPAPRLLSATALSATSVRATFDRALDPASVAPLAFSISGPGPVGLTVTGATLSAAKQVTLTTATQAALTYTLDVTSAVVDRYGTPMSATARTATFTGLGSAPVDAGTPPVDAGTPPVDAGSPIVDAGSPPVDAGTPPVDAGTPTVDGGVCGAPLVVISQLYGGGGNSGATWDTKYVELHNRGATTASVSGWTIQYHSANGTGAWYSTAALTGAKTSIPAGRFLLVALSTPSSTNGIALSPAEDLTALLSGSTLPAAGQGVFALVSNATLLPGTTNFCPASGVVDLVGYGPGATCYLGAGPTALGGAALSVTRKNTSGANTACVSTDDSAADFAVIAPVPRNSGSPASACTCP